MVAASIYWVPWWNFHPWVPLTNARVTPNCDAIIKDFCCNHKKFGIFFKSGRPRRARSRPKEPSKQACVSRTARFCVSRGRRWGGGAAVCADVRDFRKWAENRSLAGPLNFLASPSTERYSKKIGLECGPAGRPRTFVLAGPARLRRPLGTAKSTCGVGERGEPTDRARRSTLSPEYL